MSRMGHSLSDLLGIQMPAAVAVVGCGGKTSLIGALAQENKEQKVLVSPTTKIRPMPQADMLYTSQQDFLQATPENGICCAGQLDGQTGKLGGFPLVVLEEAKEQYSLLLLEADGSRGIDCKGWETFEPVVPEFCTHTIGVATVLPVGKPATEETVFRLPQFLALTGLFEGDTITIQALADMVCNDNGMFENSRGQRSVFINKVETEAQECLAKELLLQIQRKQPGRFAYLGYGSIPQQKWKSL